MGRFEHPGSDLKTVMRDLKATVVQPAIGVKGQTLGWTYERRCLMSCFRGNPIYSGYLWSVWQIFKITADGREESHSDKWISCDHIRYTNKAWWHKPLGTEADHPYVYSCPAKYLAACPPQSREWRHGVATEQALKKRLREEKKQKTTAPRNRQVRELLNVTIGN